MQFKWTLAKNLIGIPSAIGAILVVLSLGIGNWFLQLIGLFIGLAIFSIAYDLGKNNWLDHDIRGGLKSFYPFIIVIQILFWVLLLQAFN